LRPRRMRLTFSGEYSTPAVDVPCLPFRMPMAPLSHSGSRVSLIAECDGWRSAYELGRRSGASHGLLRSMSQTYEFVTPGDHRSHARIAAYAADVEIRPRST
jgi:hypothetical protein